MKFLKKNNKYFYCKSRSRSLPRSFGSSQKMPRFGNTAHNNSFTPYGLPIAKFSKYYLHAAFSEKCLGSIPIKGPRVEVYTFDTGAHGQLIYETGFSIFWFSVLQQIAIPVWHLSFGRYTNKPRIQWPAGHRREKPCRLLENVTLFHPFHSDDMLVN